MAEIKKEIKTFNVDYICDKCQVGKMRAKGDILLSNPPQYPHKCNNLECNEEKVFLETYPKIVYV